MNGTFTLGVKAVAGLGLLALLASGCGGTDEPAKTNQGAGAGGTAAGGTGGGGSGPGACGTATCKDYPVLDTLTLTACCADVAKSACGLDATEANAFLPVEGCIQLNQPGTTDTTCPAGELHICKITPNPVPLPGCRRPDQSCGVELDVKAIGKTMGGISLPDGGDFGCIDPEELFKPGTNEPCE